MDEKGPVSTEVSLTGVWKGRHPHPVTTGFQEGKLVTIAKSHL